jgi:hypothetical protein
MTFFKTHLFLLLQDKASGIGPRSTMAKTRDEIQNGDPDAEC